MNEPTPESREPSLSMSTVLTLPVVKFLALAGALLTAGWIANEKANGITQGIGKVQRDVSDLKIEFKAELERRTFDRWTRNDHLLWSYELERMNSGKLRVPEMTGTPRPNPNPP